MNVLVLNSGSSTVKFQIIETDLELIKKNADRRLAKGVLERIGSESLITFVAETKGKTKTKTKMAKPIRDHRAAIDEILRWIISPESKIDHITSLSDIHAVGHRVVHGGEQFKISCRINDEVLEGIEDNIELAPLHNPANLKGIRAVTELLGNGVPQVAVFDTSFHSTMPETSYLYGIPYHFYRRYKIRRYGFHGTSHRYVAYRYRKIRKIERERVNVITVHLGNGCSMCGIKRGGLSGLTSDMRELLEEEAENQDRRARLAIDIFCGRVRRYIGAYFADLGGTNAVLFTGGIGENSPVIRERICEGLKCIGLKLDKKKNHGAKPGAETEISAKDSKPRVMVIPTNEELLIARDTVRVVKNAPRRW